MAGNSVNIVQNKINETINELSEWFRWNRLIINKEKIAISFHKPQKVHLKCP
jgi:hypothetical protein